LQIRIYFKTKRFHDKVVIEEELNEVRNEQEKLWESTKYHLKMAKTDSSLCNTDVITVSEYIDTESEI